MRTAMIKKSIKEIRQEFLCTPDGELEAFIALYQADPRAGVQSLVAQAEKRRRKQQEEWERIETLRVYENQYAQYELICGIDEAGRGPLAGPVTAAAVILPRDSHILYINDSKKLTPKKREELFDVICDEAVSCSVGMASPSRIDEINILQATYEAMREAISQLDPAPELLLNDAVTIPGIDIPQVPIVKGDARSISIGAASIVAKVTRDRLMNQYDRLYPEYGFAAHKGYGTAEHIAALKTYGPCPIHRKTFIGHFV